MTTLPERLRASAQELLNLPQPFSHPGVMVVATTDANRIARELEEAAQVLEGAAGVATDGGQR